HQQLPRQPGSAGPPVSGVRRLGLRHELADGGHVRPAGPLRRQQRRARQPVVRRQQHHAKQQHRRQRPASRTRQQQQQQQQQRQQHRRNGHHVCSAGCRRLAAVAEQRPHGPSVDRRGGASRAAAVEACKRVLGRNGGRRRRHSVLHGRPVPGDGPQSGRVAVRAGVQCWSGRRPWRHHAEPRQRRRKAAGSVACPRRSAHGPVDRQDVSEGACSPPIQQSSCPPLHTYSHIFTQSSQH
ncbi:hypothetical protein GQ42DRAFT_21497, partial [Ramicandelaber brevisporus]